MAEDTPGFSSLDSLGPAYGGINDPSLDAQGYAPFEGDKIERPEINFPDKPFFQATPSLDLDNPATAIRQNVVAKPPHPPKKPGGKFDFDEYRKSLKDYTKGLIETSQETNDYAKIYSYNAGPDGNAFYKRYHAYGQEKFDEVGFSPLRDNEALFNSRTTLGDDFKRMMTNSFLPMFTKGFVSGPRDLAKLVTLDFSSDLEDAEEFEELAAIGQSSRGGVGAFASNTLMNFGYTAGIITEAIAEEVLGAVLAPATGGGSFFVATANNIRKLAKPLELISDGYKAVKNTLKSLNDVEAARKFWQATKTGLKSKAGRVINPLENTMDAIIDIRALKASDNLTSLAAISKTAGGFYRDVRNINMATSEARLEAGMVENHLYDDFYNEFYSKNHRAPNDDEQYDMMKRAKEGSMSTFIWNSALIYASNKITFDNITGPKGGIRNFIKSTKDEFMSVGGGKFGDLGKIVYNKAAKAFEFEAKNIKNLAKAWIKQPGLKTLGKTAGYLKANLSEGIQENLQEVIAGVNERYYKDAYKRSLVQSHLYNKALSEFAKTKFELTQEEIGKQFSAQGFETFASGALMGVFAAPLNQAIPLLTTGYNRMFNKENYQKYKANKERITKTLVETLNNMTVDEVLNARIGNLGVQEAINEIRQTGSKKEILDATTESVVEQLHVLNNAGVTDLYIDHLRSFTQMTPEELEDAMPNVPKGEGAKYIQKINEAIDRIQKVKKKYDLYTEKFPNPVELSDKDDPDADETKQKQFLYHAWDDTVKKAVYFNETFEDAMTRLTLVQEKFLNTTTHKNLGQKDMSYLFTPNDMRNELAMLKADVANMTATDPISKKQLADKKKKIKIMEDFIDKHEAFQKYHNRQDYYKSARKIFAKTLGREISDDELVTLYSKAFGALDDEKAQSKVIDNLHKSYKEYVKSIAEINDDFVFDENLDEGFKELLEHYKLASEARIFNQYVNYLHDPANFLKIVDANKEWMSKLYENRAQYFEEVIRKQMEATEDQALLNKLADKHIFVDLDEFAKWKENGTKPTQFIDDARKIVIPEGTTEYDEYYALFEQLAALREKPTSVSRDILAKELQDTLNKLDAQMNAEIDALEKTETRVELGTIKPAQKRNTFTTNKINNETAIGESVDAVNTKDETVTFTKDNEGFLRDSEGDIPSKALKFKSAVRYRTEMQADPEEVRKIEERYAELKVKAREDYNAKVQETSPGTPAEQSLAEYILANPELYNQLLDAFTVDANERLGEDVFNDLTDEQKDNEFNKFLSTGKAEIIINDYKEKQKISEGTEEAEEFKFIFNGKEVNTADVTSIKEFKDYIKGFMAAINKIRKKPVITPQDKTLLLDYEVIINKLNSLINQRVSQGVTPEMQEAIKLINKLQAMNKKANVVKPTDKSDYKVNGEDYERVSNVIKKIKSDITYTKANIINDAFDVTIGKDGFSQESIDAFIAELRSKDNELTGFFEFEGDRSEYPEGEILDTYDAVKADLESQLNAPVSDTSKKAEGTNARGTTYKGETTEKDGLKITEYSEFRPDGRRISKGGRIMTPAEFIKEYNITDQDYLDSLEGATEIRVYQVRVGKDGKSGISIQGTFPEGNVEMEVGGKESIASTTTPVSDIEAKKADIERISKLPFKERIPALIKAGIIASNVTFNLGKRFPIIVNIAGIKVAFYRSSEGTDGKQKGVWTPMFGFGENKGNPWLIKGDIDTQVNTNYNSPAIKEYADILNKTLNWDHDLDKGQVKNHPYYNVLTLVENEAAFNKELYGKEDLGIINGKTNVSGYINSKLQEINAKYDAELDALEGTQEGVNLKEFALNSVKEHTYQDSRNAGNYIDELIKNLFANKPVVYDPKKITKEAFDSLFGPDGYLTSIKERADKGEFYVATENLVVWDTIKNLDGTETKVAGEIDLLVADRDGKLHIIDVKTGKADKWSNYNTPGKPAYNQKIGNTMQQVVYSNLLYNMLDINSSIGVLPIELTYNPDGFIKTGGRPSAVKLFENDDMTILQNNKPFTVALDRSLVKDDIDKIVPKKGTDVPGSAEGNESSDDQGSPTQSKGGGKPSGDKATFKEYVNMINEAETVEELDDLEQEINTLLLKNAISQQESNELMIRLDARRTDLILNVPGIESSIAVGDTFFTQTDMGAPFNNGAEVVVTKLDNTKKIAYFKEKGNTSNKEVGVPFNKLSDYFMRPINLDTLGDKDLDKDFEDTSLSNEEESLINLNQNNVDDFLKNPTNKSKAVTDGKALDDNSAEDNIDDILNCP